MVSIKSVYIYIYIYIYIYTPGQKYKTTHKNEEIDIVLQILDYENQKYERYGIKTIKLK